MDRVRRWGLRLLALPLAGLLAGVAAPAAGSPSGPIAAGVSVGGLVVGGFRSEDARTLVRRGLSTPVEFRLGGRTWRATPKQLGFYPAVDAAVAEALRSKHGSDVTVAAAIERNAIQRYLRHLDKTFSRPPRDARVDGVDARGRPNVVPEVVGRDLDRAKTRAAIEAALGRAERTPVRPVFRLTQPKVTRRDLGPIIVIRRESNALHLYERGRLVRTLGVATGTWEYPTPLGTFEIVDMQRNPAWYPPDSDWAEGLEPIPPGPGNPLGTRWMGLNVYGVGIHGTPDAASIGYSASHGCIRMRIPDAEWLFERVRFGTTVVIVSA
ncbi:MAG TPA: L,D-transpeptidase/peptidoglycan binding protein [Gaiellaceae bacterium]|nr:L,D-transpeptidase/peptidoglycan binding protein [Gaiellaceae bacterium]